MEDLWTLFCGQCDSTSKGTEPCSRQFVFVTHPSSCINHAYMVCFDLVLLAILLFDFISKSSSQKLDLQVNHRQLSVLQKVSAVYNSCLGLVCMGLGIFILEEKLRTDHSISPVHWWSLFFLHGVTWLLLGLKIGLNGGEFFHTSPYQILSILSLLCAGFFGFLALFATLVNHERLTVKVALDIMSFLGAGLLLFCTYKGYKKERMDNNGNETLYTSLNAKTNDNKETGLATQVTLFSSVGLLSELSFYWLTPLLNMGRVKTLQEHDVPKLRDIDRAESCYLQFFNQLDKYKQSDELPSESSILRAIVACHRREILISGFFALLTILAVSAGPILLNSFIEVADGREDFIYKGNLLAISIFLSKIIESLSQRQWYFRSRLVGLKVRSTLSAAIYRKQLRLSNVSRRRYSGGEIMNYIDIDAYRIGEFPFWFHQIWTTSLQLCFALAIMINAIGLSTIASLVVIVLTVLCNAPVAKLQHKFQSKLMFAQDDRLKSCSEALVNMKVICLGNSLQECSRGIEKSRM